MFYKIVEIRCFVGLNFLIEVKVGIDEKSFLLFNLIEIKGVEGIIVCFLLFKVSLVN